MTNFPSIDFALTRPCALLVIDLQPCGTDPRFGLARALETANPGFTDHLVDRLQRCVLPALDRLLAAFHDADQPVYFTAFASAAGDGSDVRTASIRHRHAERLARTGASVVLPASDPAAAILPQLDRRAGDRILVKQSMDAFATTDLAADLQRRGVRSLALSGVYTDACIESTARSAAELGYPVFVIEDACAAWTAAFHDNSLASLGRYFARIAGSDEFLGLLRG